MSRLEIKSVKLLRDRFSNYKFTDEYDLELQQFTAEDMIEFAYYVAETSLEKASERGYCTYDAMIDKESITNPENIVLL